jgi:starch phosphorylase
MTGSTFSLELRPRIPEKLKRLEELAGNLVYAWDREVRGAFWRLDPALWRACGNNPKMFLRRIPQERLERAAEDRDFLEDYHFALSSFDSHLASGRRPEIEKHLDPERDLVAYFCAEFGLHESFPIYSGGLGILAGDHCKAVADLGVPFVGVGLLYRQGYFTQLIDGQGRQQAIANDVDFEMLPVSLCRDAAGAELRVKVQIGDHDVQLRVWLARISDVSLYLLDSDVVENNDADRKITYQLYGGDTDTRIQQEIVLGIGGVRALRALGKTPTVFHMNEGHAAFLILERIREQVAAGVDFATALELTAAGHVFTTHTPVPAGHDVFNHGQMKWFLKQTLPQLGIDESSLLAMGSIDGTGDRFNMTTFALRGSRFHNGVSKIHGGVASRMEQAMWPQVAAEDNPIGYVTNGVHMHTFIARQWTQLFHDNFREWRNRLLDTEFWNCIDTIPYDAYVAVRRKLKRDLLSDVAERLRRQLRRNGVPEAIISRATQHVSASNSRDLVLGFARRFATYKRATLILADEARLSRLLNDPERPAILIFAGKAHPKDQPGQELIKKLYETSMKPEFIGRLIMIEGYDMLLARNLVQGCDVWLNNPEYPLEASGTSGEKAGINGVVNVSVLDGWWDEGYVGGDHHHINGFAVKPVDPKYWSSLVDDATARAKRDEEEGKQLLDILEHEVVPLYYGAHKRGYAAEWVQISKNAMKTLIPRFNSARQVMDYVRQYYGPAAKQTAAFTADSLALARDLAGWKKKVREHWAGVSVAIDGSLPASLYKGETLPLRVKARLNGLSPEDVVVECVLGREDSDGVFHAAKTETLSQVGKDGDATKYSLDLEPLAGLQSFRIRMRPAHAGLSHPFELGCVVWA